MGARTVPRKSCLKRVEVDHAFGRSAAMKKVFFDEIMIKEYPTVLGNNPAVYVAILTQISVTATENDLIAHAVALSIHLYSSCGAPVQLGWKPINESVHDLDFYEYCRESERRPRKKMILSVRRRANR